MPCWADGDGLTNRLSPDGEVRRAPPHELGAIGNAHLIRLAAEADDGPWDEDFENAFDRADSAFPGVIEWLDGLERVSPSDASSRLERFHAVDVQEARLRILVECLVSLAVRSPMNRESAVSVAEHFRGPLRGSERNAIIGLNMRRCQRTVSDSIGSRGKFAVLFSRSREFIFGDGFFHNIRSPSEPPRMPQILAPVTPQISVLHAIPRRYRQEPRLVTLVLNEDEVDLINDCVLVYSSKEVFFRSQCPRVSGSFREGKHLRYRDRDHPIEHLVHEIPGVVPLDLSLEKMLARFRP